MQTQTLFLVFFLGLPWVVEAQSSAFLSDFQKKWANAAAYTLDVAEAMPEEAYDFRPVAAEMSFKEQLLHMMGNTAWLRTAYLGGEKSGHDLKATDYTKEQIIEIIREEFRLSGLAAEGLTPAALEEEVKFFAGPMNKRQIIILMNDHMTHHRGQLVVYLRLNGVKPPAYRGW